MENPAVRWVLSFIISLYQIPPPSAKALSFLHVLRCDMLVWTHANLLLALMTVEQNTTKNGNNRQNLGFFVFILLIVLEIHRRALIFSLQRLSYNYILYFFFFLSFSGTKVNKIWREISPVWSYNRNIICFRTKSINCPCLVKCCHAGNDLSDVILANTKEEWEALIPVNTNHCNYCSE